MSRIKGSDDNKDSEEAKAPDRVPAKNRNQDTVSKDQHQQDLLDEAIEESFPASDSPTAAHVD